MAAGIAEPTIFLDLVMMAALEDLKKSLATKQLPASHTLLDTRLDLCLTFR